MHQNAHLLAVPSSQGAPGAARAWPAPGAATARPGAARCQAYFETVCVIFSRAASSPLRGALQLRGESANAVALRPRKRICPARDEPRARLLVFKHEAGRVSVYSEGFRRIFPTVYICRSVNRPHLCSTCCILGPDHRLLQPLLRRPTQSLAACSLPSTSGRASSPHCGIACSCAGCTLQERPAKGQRARSAEIEQDEPSKCRRGGRVRLCFAGCAGSTTGRPPTITELQAERSLQASTQDCESTTNTNIIELAQGPHSLTHTLGLSLSRSAPPARDHTAARSCTRLFGIDRPLAPKQVFLANLAGPGHEAWPRSAAQPAATGTGCVQAN